MKNPTGECACRVRVGPPLALAVFIKRPQAELKSAPCGNDSKTRVKMRCMRALLATILLLGASAGALAAVPTYAVVSLVGDRLLISQYVPGTGSHIDRNTRQFAAMPDDALDRLVLERAA